MGILDNWSPVDEASLSSLIAYERMLYRTADIRYGIGRKYIDHWARQENLPAEYFDVRRIYSGSDFSKILKKIKSSNEPKLPDLCFIGRQEQWKGPEYLP